MQYPIPGTRTVRRASAAALLLAACGGDAVEERAKDTSAADVSEVDQKSSATATDRELASFKEPADSILTPEQVNAFLRTSLLQFDLIQAEAGKYRNQAAQMAQRAEKNPNNAVTGFRNGIEAMQWMAGFGDLVGGSYTRAARSQGYNPAEMDWVRARMMEVSTSMITRPIMAMGLQSAQAMRQQAEQMRGQPGVDEAYVQQLLQSADEAEKQAREQMNGAGGAAARNIEVLRRARPNVTEHMWMMVSVASATGVLGLGGLADPADTTAMRNFREIRQVYTDALANRVTPGMEADKAMGEAKPQVSATAPGQGN
jgi:ElaB/YqjD/DUF883 family membrane-anchored ribosome-binding protein